MAMPSVPAGTPDAVAADIMARLDAGTLRYPWRPGIRARTAPCGSGELRTSRH